MKNSIRRVLASSVALSAIVAASSAMAGGFINQSQSTVFNGMAYAGWGAMGGDPSSMFINPATMSQFAYFTTSTNLFGVFPFSNIRGSGNTAAPPNNSIPSGDIGQDAFSSASYFILPLNHRLNVGLAVNSPYGFTTSPNTPWGGQNVSETTSLRTYTFTPSMSYKLSDTLSVGLGVQAQYAKARFVANALPPPANPGILVGLKGDGWGFGVTAGVTWQPWAGTSIGLGYRSRMNQEIEGRFLGFESIGFAGAIAAFGNRAQGYLQLPDRVNLSVRHALNPQLDVLGTVEWQGWSRIGTSRINSALVANVGAFPLRALPFEYKDGWFFSTGAEYKYSPNLTVRAGVAYEISPVTDRVRSTRLTDNDRLWTSLGLSYKWSERFTINASYSHVFVRDASINIGPGNPNFNGAFTYTGKAKSHVDIISLGLTSTWGGPAAPAVIAKY